MSDRFKDQDKWVEHVSKWRDATNMIPSMVSEEIRKSKLDPELAAKGPKSLVFDPLSIQFAMGYKDRRYSLSYETLKRIPQQLALISAILQTRCNQVAQFATPFRLNKSLGFAVKHKNPARLTTKGEREFIQSVEKFIYACGAEDPNPHSPYVRDDFETFLKKLVRDSLMYDQATFEVVPDRKGMPYEFLAVDASTIRIASNHMDMDLAHATHTANALMRGHAETLTQPYKTMKVQNPELHDVPAYVQLINGQQRNVYTNKELVFGVRNPRSDIYVQGYGYGELEQLITVITAHLYAEEYNRRFFMQGCVAGDTTVHTRDGLVPISSLVGKVFDCWNGTEWVTSDVVSSGYKEAVSVGLANNYSLITSPNHKFLSLSCDGQAVMKELQELRVGDFVAQSEALLEFNELDPVYVQVGKKPKQPTVNAGLLDAPFYEFIGFLVGDGYVTDTRSSINAGNKRNYTTSCVFSPKDTEVQEKFRTMLGSRGISHHMRKSGGDWGGTKLDTLVIRNKGLFDFLTNVVGMSSSASHEKVVPSRLFAETVENRAAFLRGYFSADGFVKNGIHAYVCSSSTNLIAGVQQLLWSLGISSSLSHSLMNASGRPCHYLRVCENNKFASLIGFLQTYKTVSPTRKDSGGKIPRFAQEGILQRLIGYVPGGTRSKAQLKALRSSAQEEALNYRWIQIKSINVIGVHVPMFDVRQTHEGHRWSAGGCITSNSAPKGILNIKGDNLTGDQLEVFKREWKNNVEGVTNAWRTPIMQSEQGIDWVPLHQSNQEMEYSMWMEYLIKITCFTGNTPITMADGSTTAIESVVPGDVVFSHTGQPRNVSNLQITEYCGPLVTLTAGETIEVTPEHPMWVVSSSLHNGSRLFGEPAWKNAGEIVEGVDYLTIPKKTYEFVGKDQTIDCLAVLGADNCRVSPDALHIAPKGNAGKFIQRYWALDEELAYVLGLYLAEGNTTESAAYFTFAKHEEEYVAAVERIATRIGVHSRTYAAKESTANICLHSSLVAEVLGTLFGSKAILKKIPKVIFDSPAEVQRAFISGVFAGDGSVPSFVAGAAVSTLSLVSKTALEQMRHLLFRQNVYSHRYTVTNTGFDSVNDLHRLDINGLYSARLSTWLSGPKGDKLRDRVNSLTTLRSTVYESATYYYVPVSSSNTNHFEGKVYNIEVDGEHTYQAHRFAVHNCAVFLIDPAELNFDMHGGVQQTPLFESSQEWKLKASRDRGLKPMLRFLAKLINDNVVNKLDDNFTFDFVGLDELTEQEKHELRKEQVSTYMTLNEIRRQEDLPDVADGDLILNPTYTTAQQQRRQLEQQQAAAGAAGGGAPPPSAQPGKDKPEAQVAEDNSKPSYSDGFTKSIDTKTFEVSFDQDESWLDFYRGV